MKRNKIHHLLLGALLSVGVAACSAVPLSGRQQMNVVPDSEVLAMSAQQYRDFISRAPLSQNQQQTQRVRTVGQRIAAATEQYLVRSGLGQEAKKFAWEFNLVQSKSINAWCMPGGKIVVYEGILPYCKTDDELATVMAHEVAHALAKHANERMSQQLMQRTGAQVLGSVLSGSSVGAQVAGGLAYSVGSKVLFELPYSRQHEFEADKIGLYLMAMAGYDYNQAATFWTNMAGGRSGNSDFLSTHPANAKRIEAINAEIPKVQRFMGSDTKAAPNPVPKRNRAVTKEQVEIPGNNSREVPLKTHY